MTRLLSLLILVGLGAIASAQSCELWAGSPPECAPWLEGEEIFLFEGLTQDFVAAQIANLTKEIALDLPPGQCKNSSLPFACKNAFPKCVVVNETDGTNTVVWQPQCQSVCTQVNAYCAVIYEALDTTGLDCTAPNTFDPAYTFYPVGNLSITLPDGTLYSQACDASLVSEAGSCPVTWDGPLHPVPAEEVAEFPNGPFPCWLCPFPALYSRHTYALAADGAAVIGGIAILLGWFTMIPFLVPARRKYPAILPLYLAISGHGLAWSWAATGMHGWHETVCRNAYRIADWHNASCVIQAFCLIVFSLASIYWTTAIIFNVFWSVVAGKEVKKWWHYLQLALCFGMPLISGLVLLAARQADYEYAGNCFFADTVPGTFKPLKHIYITWFMWYFPIASLLLVNLLMIAAILFTIFKNASDWNVAKRVLKNQWRTFAYMVFFAYTAGYVVGIWAVLESSRSETSKDDVDFVTCLFSGGVGGDTTKCRITPKVSKAAFVLYSWTNALIPVWFFFIFGISRDNLRWWREFTSGLLRGEAALGFSLSKTFGTTASRSNPGQSSGNFSGDSNGSNVVSRL